MARLSTSAGTYVVFTAAGMRMALPAASVLEICAAEGLEARARALGIPLGDFGALFGVAAQTGATGDGLLVDLAPPRLLRVVAVHDVADLGETGFFALPGRLRLALQGAVRCARLHRGDLVLELAPEALATVALAPLATASPQVPEPLPAAPDPVLVFRSGDKRLAVGLEDISQILSAPRVCPVPLLPAHLLGLVHHERTLYLAADAAMPLGGATARPPPLVVLIDAGGVPMAIAATRVDGFKSGLALLDERVPGAWLLADANGKVYLPAFDRLFD